MSDVAHEVELTAAERSYVEANRIGRLATADADGSVDVAPLVYTWDGARLFFGGLRQSQTPRHRNIVANPKVAVVIDDVESVDPWAPRGIKFHGTAEIIEARGRPAILVTPQRKYSWGINQPCFTGGYADYVIDG